MKKKIVIALVVALAVAGAVFASGHIRSQSAKCDSCSCTYFSCGGDIGGSCYCKCGHSWRAHR